LEREKEWKDQREKENRVGLCQSWSYEMMEKSKNKSMVTVFNVRQHSQLDSDYMMSILTTI
jgi:hypothetical protein